MSSAASDQPHGAHAVDRGDSSPASVEWKNIQKNTFCRWANERLRTSGLEIGDLATDLSDGILLIRLAESLSGVKIAQRYNAKPTTRTQKLENVTVCLHFLERQQRVRIVNIGKHCVRLVIGAQLLVVVK